ncbi:MAG: 7-cyano-7-deazaguanine synthase QueC [Candidatus Kaelpia aquatica]|nr:7-cyano-7-deazaguanine synthase QueC [Candidatus Kaelpia aquatica]
MNNKKGIVLLSGGLDSSTSLYYALDKGYEIKALIFDYGQRDKREIDLAKSIAQAAGVEYEIINLDFSWGGSALLDKDIELPQGDLEREDIPLSYVPSRNIVFLSIALSYAEAKLFDEIFIGANAVDYSGYPDCRPDFMEAFQRVADCGTKSGIEGRPIKISAPLLKLKKSEIIKLGNSLGVPFDLTSSCYEGDSEPCMKCDSCLIRERGFKEAGLEDPIIKR